MIDSQSYRGILFFVTSIAVFFAVLQHFGISSVFYFWEIAIDIKIVSIFGYLYALYKKQKFVLNITDLKLFPGDWYRNIIFFFIPIFIYGFVAFLGLIFGSVTLTPLENKPTVVLAALFDLPAIFIFSITIILMEEMVFRSILLKSGFGSHSNLQTFIVINIIWSIYSILSIIDVTEANFLILLSIFLSQFSIGFFLSCVVMKYRSIWLAYSFRIGMKIIPPLMMKSVVLDADPFFTTHSLFFSAEGWLSSVIILLFAIYCYQQDVKMIENQTNFRKNIA
ncbi:MAG: CPBP family glutamic-type intramembrane protease [Bacteroidota bacterium]|jgi:membrane protease YdiL (CAAX protease family)